MDELGSFLTVIITSVLQLLLPVALAAAVAWLATVLQSWRRRLGDQKWRIVMEAAAIAVSAAEQSGLAGLIAREGAVKKQYAVQAAQRILNEYGLRVNAQTIADVIESIIYATNLQPINEQLAVDQEGPPPHD